MKTPKGLRPLPNVNALECERCGTRISAQAIVAMNHGDFDWAANHGCGADALTDEQLRAEFKRRFGYEPGEAEHDFTAVLRERDEWKRRAEVTERDNAYLRTVVEHCTRHHILGSWARGECGPGIATMRPDTSHFVDPLELLADDE